MSSGPHFTGLPPRPDPDTGKPFPPHGLGWRGDDRSPEDAPDRETRLPHKPSPPPDKGPVLAWHKENTRAKVVGFFWGAAIIMVGGTILAAIEGDPPLEWVRYWGPWVIIVVGGLVMTSPLKYVGVSAGADWAQLQVSRFGVVIRKNHVNLYDLREIKMVNRMTLFILVLSDDNDSISIASTHWQADRRIWDLVYNGILHSVAAGAAVNHNARGFLQLDKIPELRYPHGVRTIDVTKLSDIQVWELMEDPMVRRLCDTIEFQGSAAMFREKFPEFDENMLANPANPAWFVPSTDTGPQRPDRES